MSKYYQVNNNRLNIVNDRGANKFHLNETYTDKTTRNQFELLLLNIFREIINYGCRYVFLCKGYLIDITSYFTLTTSNVKPKPGTYINQIIFLQILSFSYIWYYFIFIFQCWGKHQLIHRMRHKACSHPCMGLYKNDIQININKFI